MYYQVFPNRSSSQKIQAYECSLKTVCHILEYTGDVAEDNILLYNEWYRPISIVFAQNRATAPESTATYMKHILNPPASTEVASIRQIDTVMEAGACR